MPRRRLARLAWLCLLAPLALACDDPVKVLTQAIEDGKKAAIVQAAGRDDESFADDEAAKARSGGQSLGPGHAVRLYYQFIDARGGVVFVERLEDVPAAWRDKVGFVEMDSPPPLSPAMAEQTRDRRYAAAGGGPRGSGTLVAARAADPVILYSAEWCGWCKKARRHLDGMGVDYEIRDIDIPANLDALVAKTGRKGIPVLDVGGRIVRGFSPDEYDQLLRSRT